MKKRYIVMTIAALAIVALLVPAAFAAVNQPDNAANQQFFNQMFDWHKSWVNNAVENGQINEEQAKVWNQHFDQMREFHSKYGMGPMGGMMMGGFNGSWGMGPGMMGNFAPPVSQ